MAGTVVIIVLLVLFPVVFLMTNVVGAALRMRGIGSGLCIDSIAKPTA